MGDRIRIGVEGGDRVEMGLGLIEVMIRTRIGCEWSGVEDR